jgi:two-component system, OmpR family, response regulator
VSRILVAEDMADIRRLLVQALAAPGRQFIVAADGHQALTAWSKGSCSLLILDFMMPGCTGLDVARRVRDAGDGTPVILMSATMDEEIRREAEALGAVECVEKPFVLADLRASVDRVLGPSSRHQDHRLGSLALRRGLLTTDQLRKALAAQRQEASRGAPVRRLGAICQAEGFLSEAQVEALLHKQRKLLAGPG